MRRSWSVSSVSSVWGVSFPSWRCGGSCLSHPVRWHVLSSLSTLLCRWITMYLLCLGLWPHTCDSLYQVRGTCYLSRMKSRHEHWVCRMSTGTQKEPLNTHRIWRTHHTTHTCWDRFHDFWHMKGCVRQAGRLSQLPSTAIWYQIVLYDLWSLVYIEPWNIQRCQVQNERVNMPA